MPPKKQTTASSQRFDRLPAELVRICADFSDAPAALALHEACNKQACGVALALAFKNANELRRAARLRTESDENMFKRWESLVCPLRCVVVVMKESAVSRIFRGAAKRGIEALSELDASRVDLVNRKRDVNWRVIDKHLRKVMREMPPSLQGLSSTRTTSSFCKLLDPPSGMPSPPTPYLTRRSSLCCSTRGSKESSARSRRRGPGFLATRASRTRPSTCPPAAPLRIN